MGGVWFQRGEGEEEEGWETIGVERGSTHRPICLGVPNDRVRRI